MQQKPVLLVTHVRHFAGPALIHRLLSEDMTLVCHDRTFAETGARNTFRTEHPGAEALTAIEPTAIAQEIADRFGRLDVLVSNDPHPAVRAPIEEAAPEEFRRALEALAVWPYSLIGRTVPMLKQRSRSRIVIVSSAAPVTGIPNYTMYAAARGAINALVKSLARELAPSGISVNAIAANFIKNPDYFPPELIANEGAMAKILKNIPLGRLGEPEEVAELIALLAGGRCGFVTGQIIPIAGGWA